MYPRSCRVVGRSAMSAVFGKSRVRLAFRRSGSVCFPILWIPGSRQGKITSWLVMFEKTLMLGARFVSRSIIGGPRSPRPRDPCRGVGGGWFSRAPPLLVSSGWVPAEPVDLGAVNLAWTDESPSHAITGGESE